MIEHCVPILGSKLEALAVLLQDLHEASSGHLAGLGAEVTGPALGAGEAISTGHRGDEAARPEQAEHAEEAKTTEKHRHAPKTSLEQLPRFVSAHPPAS